jgi:hypothetical protein
VPGGRVRRVKPHCGGDSFRFNRQASAQETFQAMEGVGKPGEASMIPPSRRVDGLLEERATTHKAGCQMW